MLFKRLSEVFIKIEVKDNNVEQALRVLKRKFKETVFKVIKQKILMKNPQKRKKNSSRKY